jgi:hypothetical protein
MVFNSNSPTPKLVRCQVSPFHPDVAIPSCSRLGDGPFESPLMARNHVRHLIWEKLGKPRRRTSFVPFVAPLVSSCLPMHYSPGDN